MGLRSDSVAGVRFLAAAREGRGIKPAARSVGIHPWTGYRWLREAVLAGMGDGRHHLRVRVEVEEIFRAHYDQGGSVSGARAVAGVGQATAYRWLQARFIALRDAGKSRAAAARQLRLSRSLSEQWELVRRHAHLRLTGHDRPGSQTTHDWVTGHERPGDLSDLRGL